MQSDIKKPTLERFGRQLTEARMRKNLSQRDLSERTATPQAHISKIEQGKVDLRLSSLVELARALDLELQLVPRQASVAVDGLVRAVEAELPTSIESRAIAELDRFADFLETLRAKAPRSKPIDALEDTLRELRRLPFDNATSRRLHTAFDVVRRAFDQGHVTGFRDEDLGILVNANRTLRMLRNDFVHARPALSSERPLYQLSEDDDD